MRKNELALYERAAHSPIQNKKQENTTTTTQQKHCRKQSKAHAKITNNNNRRQYYTHIYTIYKSNTQNQQYKTDFESGTVCERS